MRLLAGIFAVLTLVAPCGVPAARLPETSVADPTASATVAEANYCYARAHGLDPDHLPTAYLVLKMRVRVDYHNPGPRALIVPLERDQFIYTALKPGITMTLFRPRSFFEPSPRKPMTNLPDDVNAADPFESKNDFFARIPAGGDLSLPDMQTITMPVDRKRPFKPDLDLRGQKVYFRMRFAHRELSPELEAELSDRWSRFGAPWTGVLTTNTFAIDIPAHPQAEPCNDYQSTAR